MKIISVNLFQFSELSEAAKKRAIDNERKGFEFFEQFVMEDAENVLQEFGFSKVKIAFSGFWSQGDGACFSGNWAYKAGFLKVIEKNFPDWLPYAKALQQVAKKDFYNIKCKVFTSGQYSHEYTMQIAEVSHKEKGWDYAFNTEKEYLEVFRNMARKIYKDLEYEYNFQSSDEQIIESFEANDVLFTKDGKVYYE